MTISRYKIKKMLGGGHPYLSGEGWYALKDLPKGEFIKRTATAKKVYRKGNYDRKYKAFRVDDQDDISRDMLVKGNTSVYAGFTY